MEHWLDYAKEKFGSRHVADLKRFLELIKMFSPLIVYWLAYFTLVNSLSLHASQMNGDFGFMIFCVSELEIMQDLIILILIPVIYFGFYPLMNRWDFL